jgi:hypothetical protein
MKPLRSSAPHTSILNPRFRYTPAAAHEPVTNPLLEKFRAMQPQQPAKLQRVVDIRRKR